MEKHEATVVSTPVSGSGEIMIFHFLVDYGRSVEDGVKAGRYNLVRDGITSCNFPTRRSGTVNVVMELTPLNVHASIEDAQREFGERHTRPAELPELLVLGEKHPEIQRQFSIVALGSVLRDRPGSCLVPCLEHVGLLRTLGLSWILIGPDNSRLFAAIREQS